MQVLDVGTGTGFLLPALSKRVGPNGHVHALDVQPAMLERARKVKLPFDNVSFHLTDASYTSLDDGSLDRVIIHHAFHEISDRCGAIHEFRRILKTGGIVILWEPRVVVGAWRVRGYEGMFWGAGFELDRRITDPLGRGCLFRAVDGPLGSRLHSKT